MSLSFGRISMDFWDFWGIYASSKMNFQLSQLKRNYLVIQISHIRAITNPLETKHEEKIPLIYDVNNSHSNMWFVCFNFFYDFFCSYCIIPSKQWKINLVKTTFFRIVFDNILFFCTIFYCAENFWLREEKQFSNRLKKWRYAD